jgi:hypothetical protein
MIKKLTKRTYEKAVTVWESPTLNMHTQWGTLPYVEWCQKESRRMNACGGNTLVCQEPEGLVAICRP